MTQTPVTDKTRKKCVRCGQEKPTSHFHKSSLYADGRMSACSSCENRKRLERNERIRALIRAAKDKPCADCGGAFHHSAMDFDHLGDKSFSVAQAPSIGASWARVQNEIAKCEVVCSNCHRVRTWTRRNQ